VNLKQDCLPPIGLKESYRTIRTLRVKDLEKEICDMVENIRDCWATKREIVKRINNPDIGFKAITSL